MRKDVRALAIKYVEDVLADQRQLGYSGRVPRETREKAITNAEVALRDLAAAANSKKSVAA